MAVCNCFGLSPMPASKFPVKRYNYLVPGIFPLTPPAIDEDLPAWIGKKLEKLHEYIQLNPKNTAKVSRRLERRIRSELKSKALGLGYVKIAVHAYVYLLAHSQVKDVILYAEELIRKEDSVIEILLKNKSIHLNILGAELLAHFLKKQTDSVSFNRLESVVPLICKLCNSMSKRGETDQNRTANEEDRKLQLELRVACLRSLREHVAFMHRLLVPLGDKQGYLENVMSCVLDNLGSKEVLLVKLNDDRQTPDSTIPPSSPVNRFLNSIHQKNTFLSRRTQPEASTSFDFAFTVRTGDFDNDFLRSDGPSTVAAQVLRELGHLSRGARSAEQILTVLLNQFDRRHDWQGAEIIQLTFDVMHEAFAREHQQFLFFKILLKHAANANSLEFEERISLIKIALEEGLGQDSQLAVLVLGQCLDCLHHQLPKPRSDVENELIPVATDFSDQPTTGQIMVSSRIGVSQETLNEETLRDVILSGIAQIARRVEGSMQLVDTLLGVLDKREHSFNYNHELQLPTVNLALFECVMAAAQALSDLPEEGGRLPARMFDSTIYQLLGMLSELPPIQAVYVQGTLRMMLLVSPKGQSLTTGQIHSLLSSIYNAVKNNGNSPHNYSEFSALFYTLMSKSDLSGWMKGLQFVHSLWKEALDESEQSHFYEMDSTHLLAILFFANQCLVTIGKLIGSENLSESRLPLVKDALDPCLKPSRQFGGVLSYSASGFLPEIAQRAPEVLGQLRFALKSIDLSKKIHEPLQLVKEGDLVDGKNFDEFLKTPFIPEDQHCFLQRQKLGLSRSGTVDESLHGETTDLGAVEEWSKRVYWMYNKSSSHSRSNKLPNADRLNSIERLSSGFLDSHDNFQRPSITHENSDRPRGSYLREILNSPSDQFESFKIPDVNMEEYPQVGYIP
eukprot:g6955.t1